MMGVSSKNIKLQQLFSRAVACCQSGDFQAAMRLFRQILDIEPRQFDTLHQLGIIYARLGDATLAIRYLDAAIAVAPKSAEAHLSLGNVRMGLGQAHAALAAYEQALLITPDVPEILYSRGNALRALGRLLEAFDAYSHVLRQMPDQPEVLTNRGNTLHDLGRYDDALADYDRALAKLPRMAMLHSNRAGTLRELRRYDEALTSLDRADSLDPESPESLINRANVLRDLGRHDEALTCYERGVAMDENNPLALNNLGDFLVRLGRFDQAWPVFSRLASVRPDWEYVQGMLWMCRRSVCSWEGFEQAAAGLVQAVNEGKKADTAFSFLSMSDSGAAQLQCAKTFAFDNYPPFSEPVWKGERYRHDRIRVGYVSGDFCDHPVTNLLTGVIESHDRVSIEPIGISLAADDGSTAGRRIREAFERCHDFHRESNREIAALMRELEIDIAVDLMGFTRGNRAWVFASRPAPVQVNYLGFPGTMGAPYIDYVIADNIVVPERLRHYMAESVVSMPYCFQANDNRRPVAGQTSSRADEGLPLVGFVFCCFNANYKLTPEVFKRWLNLLKQLDGSVLWLVSDHLSVEDNLRAYAVRYGVKPERLVFAKRVSYPEHLARMSLADLFLDTFPFNAGTTASDALWAGVPVLTLAGQAFASRMAASLLHAIGLPELVTDTGEAYQNLAIRLATNPAWLRGLRQRLIRNRETHPLFDAKRFCRHLEQAYQIMWSRYQSGESPSGISVIPEDRI